MQNPFEGSARLQNLFIPDPWQVEAVNALREGHDVIVDAPTGSGKTWIFEKCAALAHFAVPSVFTVPTRALANDKFAEWSARGWPVGIITGETVQNAEAPLIVGTLEAVRDLPRHRPDLALFVIDEYQWLAHPQRGNHYEGMIVSLAPAIRLLLLSGSVANPADLAAWFTRLGRRVRVVSHRRRPVPLEEINADELARRAPRDLEGFWVRRLYTALRDNLGPVLVFVPHRREAERLARAATRDLPPLPRAVELTGDQERILGAELSRMVHAGISYHHSGITYAQRAGVIEPLAKAGKLRVVVATLGLASGINFSLRSVMITARHYRMDGADRDITGAEILQMAGRAGRRGLDETGYFLSTEKTPTLSEARPEKCRRAPPFPWSDLLRLALPGEPITERAVDFSRKLFSESPLPVGVEATRLRPVSLLPCGERTDTARARLIRRKTRKFPGCKNCVWREECRALSPAPSLLWLWQKLGLLDRALCVTPRGEMVSHFSGAEGLALMAALEAGDYPPGELVFDLANLFAAERFSQHDAPLAGRLAALCQETYRHLSIDGYLRHGIPEGYGAGGSEIIRKIILGAERRARLTDELAGRGDIDRLFVEWRSLMRQIVHAPDHPHPGW
ncbi:MAG: DEAD/DEAH box helicase, partial [Verrucomicrobiae bacterium]|nr:DEAD/DEAH box helicase [Verrucomicrobiae bacterium]